MVRKRLDSPGDLVRAWFSLTEPVDRKFYVTSGLALGAVKYAVDAFVVWFMTGVVWTPLLYLNPTWGARELPFGKVTGWLVWTLVLWALPFLWIGASMTVRRAIDAGFSPWVGALFFLPIVNWLVMVTLALVPSAEAELVAVSKPRSSPALGSGVHAAALAALSGFVLAAVSVFGVGTYGGSLFVGTPFLMGMVAAYLFNRDQPRPPLATLFVAESSLLLAAGCLVLTAIEGVFCLVMALPIAVPLAALGGMMGHALAARGRPAAPSLAGMLIALPLAAGIEAAGPAPLVRAVTTTIVVDATPEAVWPNVIGFSTLPAPEELAFRLGIAHPLRARIDGAGVGAIRHCEFSTGAFVEPITVWDEPRRLAFDVAAQPPSMEELSPYPRLAPPHLIDGFTAVRGEFRLTALEGDRTRLEGTTWYRSRLFPAAYWRLWSDALVHAIHHRVLEHVAQLSTRVPIQGTSK